MGLEVAFADGQQRDVADDAIGVRDTMAQRDCVEIAGEARPGDRAADERPEFDVSLWLLDCTISKLRICLHLPSEPPSASDLSNSRVRSASYIADVGSEALKQELLLQRLDDPLRDTVALRLMHEGRRTLDPEKFDLVLEVIGHVSRAMVVAKNQTGRNIFGYGAEVPRIGSRASQRLALEEAWVLLPVPLSNGRRR